MAAPRRGQLAQLRTLLISIAILATLVLIRPVIWGAASLLLMLFAALLLAVFLDGAAFFARTYLKLPRPFALIGVVLLIVLAAGALMWTAGPRISEQTGLLIERLPESVQEIDQWIQNTPWANRLLEALPASDRLVPGPTQIVEAIPGFFYTTVGDLIGVTIVLITGFYLALEPRVYRQGLLALVPARRQQQCTEILDALEKALHWWLVGRLTAMLAIGALTILGLWLIDVPLALLLGLLAGVLSFIPVLGPIISAVPAVLIAIVGSPAKALGVIGVFAAVQFLEGNLITPLIQKRTVSMPPAILLASQLLLGVPFGLVGVLLATPLAVALIVVVQIAYVRDYLGKSVEPLGARRAGNDQADAASSSRQSSS